MCRLLGATSLHFVCILRRLGKAKGPGGLAPRSVLPNCIFTFHVQGGFSSNRQCRLAKCPAVHDSGNSSRAAQAILAQGHVFSKSFEVMETK